MAYKCLDCGHIFDRGEEKKYEDRHNLDTPPYETWYGCPLCGGGYEETIPCDICGSEHLDSELVNGVCQECLDANKYDIQMCYNVGSNDTEKISINSFLASVFEIDEIEEILLKVLLRQDEEEKINNCKKFIALDEYWYLDVLAEEVKKNENGKG